MNNSKNKFTIVSFLFYFLFGGAIVGETVSLTLVVSVLGPTIMSKLFLINGALLFLLPPLFFQNIDKLNRGKFLSLQLLTAVGILGAYFLGVQELKNAGQSSTLLSFLVLIIYPISYMSKTLLFLTFWTLANDIYNTDEAKKGFPIVAAWGFIGGLTGACIARLLLEKADTLMILGLWIFAYAMAWTFARRATKLFWVKLLKKEESVKNGKENNLFSSMKLVVKSKLIQLISALYFSVFVAIFLQDYLFLKKSASIYATPHGLASFLFTFYLIHGLATIGGLRFVVPKMIHQWGFTKIFMILPLTLCSGSILLLLAQIIGFDGQILFALFIVIQFARYVVFENAFSPIYQMFFAAVPKEHRGRAKTFLEGIIKPFAIMIAGITILLIDKSSYGVIVVVLMASLSILFIVVRLRKTYLETLVSQIHLIDVKHEIISSIGSRQDLKLLSLIKEYSHSNNIDVRSLCVKILANDGSKQAFKILENIFNEEQSKDIKETIARSLSKFTMVDTKIFIDKLLNHTDNRIRANALYSLNAMEPIWKRQFQGIIRSLILETNPRLQIEAARYLWMLNEKEDRITVLNILERFCISKNANKRSAGMYLIGALKPEKWEIMLLDNLQSASVQVYTKCMEVIFSYASKETRLKTLQSVEHLSRNHISIIGKILQKIGMPAFDALVDFLRSAQNQRMIVEVIHALRMVIEPGKPTSEKLFVDKETRTALVDLVHKDFERIYRESTLWWQFKTKTPAGSDGISVLEDALRDQLVRVCERSLDVMVLLDSDGIMSTVRKDIDLKDYAQRLDMAEIIESMTDTVIGRFVVPILRSEGWEDIAKIGKKNFNIEDNDFPHAVSYFVRSKNKWVCFCALYCLYKSLGSGELVKREHAILVTLQHGPNIYLSRVACQLLLSGAKKQEENVEAFELLERVMSLKKTALFHTIDAEKLMGVAEISRLMSYKSGTLISREGEVSDHLYIIRNGSLKIVKSKNNVKTILSILHAGETYGEIGLFNQAPRSASAIAQEDCELWVIQRSSLKKILLEMPEIAYNFLEVFSDKLRKNSEEVATLRNALNSKKEYLL